MRKETQRLINQLESRRGRADLTRLKKALQELGNPHKKVPCVHVAGTNGKGSTVNDIRSIMQTAGYRVGTFTSPSMETHFDRIRINDEPISEDDFLEEMKYYETWAAKDMTMFEIDFLIAANYFAKRQVDLVVYEVGLGGRFDTTNVITPLACVITNIGFDHMALLGDKIEEIAYAKAGIIKKGVPVITAERNSNCLAVFQAECNQVGTTLSLIDEITCVTPQKQGIAFRYQNETWQLSSHASYQCMNAACALEVIEVLRKHGFKMSKQQCYDGLYNAFWLGRFEVIRKEPLLIIDGAHNAHGIKALVSAMPKVEHLKIIVSILQDKNLEEMLYTLQMISQDIEVVQFESERVLRKEMIEGINGVKWRGAYEERIKLAWQGNQPVLITGSLYFISDVRKYLRTLGAFIK